MITKLLVTKGLKVEDLTPCVSTETTPLAITEALTPGLNVLD